MEKSKNSIYIYSRETVELKPDIIKLYVLLKGDKDNYEQSLDELNRESTKLKEILLNAGVDENKIFLNDIEFLLTNDYNEGKIIKTHYTTIQKIIIEFDFEMKKLAKCLQDISKSINAKSLEVCFEVKDKKAGFDMALAKSIQSGKQRAQLIAKEAGLDLGDIINIKSQDSPENVNGRRLMRSADYAVKMSNSIENMSVSNIQISVGVEMEWSIK